MAELDAPAPTSAEEVRQLLDSQQAFSARGEAGERRGLFVRLGKVRGYAPASALEGPEQPDELVGRDLLFRVMAIAPDGKRALLTTLPGWSELSGIMEREEVVAARIAEVLRGGLVVEVEGVPCFLPANRIIELRGGSVSEAFADRVGSEIDVRVIDLEVRQREAQYIASTDLDHDRAAAAEGMRALAEHRESGRPIEADVIRANSGGLVISVGGAHAFVPKNACGDGEDDEELADRVGERIRVAITGSNLHGRVIASERSVLQAEARAEAWDEIERLRDEGEVFEAEAAGSNKDGVLVDIGGIRGFLPWSQMADGGEAWRSRRGDRIGTRLDLRVIEVQRYRSRAIVSERAAADEGDSDQPAEILAAGEVRTGRIERITATGILMDVDGASGFVPRPETSWLHNADPAELHAVGDEVAVRVTGAARGARPPSLSIRQAAPEPWLDAVAALRVGEVVPATVTKLVSFGAFARVDEAVEGLVHLSELLEREIDLPEDAVAAGDVIPVRILEIDPDTYRVGLSLRQAVDEAEEMGWEFDEDGYVAGVPDDAEPIAQRLRELGNGRPAGEKVDISEDADAPDEPAAIASIAVASPQHGAEETRDEDERDGEESDDRGPDDRESAGSLLDDLEEGQIRSGRVTGFRNFGVFVDLGGESGLIHRSELSWDGRLEPEDAAEVGETVEVFVMKVDKAAKRIGLSLRRAAREEWDEAAATFSAGDVVPAEVVKLVNFGAFARIAPPIEGLIHRTELDDEEVSHPSEVVEAGDLVPVKILDIDEEQCRVMLSLKQAFDQAEDAGWELDEYGRVERLPDEVAERYGFEQAGDGPPVRIPAVE